MLQFYENFMKFVSDLQTGHLVQRYKRFMADITTTDQETITAHCPNTGPMTDLIHPGSLVAYSHQDGKNRKYPYTWEMAWVDDTWVGVNTQTPNKLIRCALGDGEIEPLSSYKNWRSEVPVGGHSRLDFYADAGPDEDTKGVYVEVKNVHWRRGSGAFFPDTVTTRGTKHLHLLMELVSRGFRAVMIYVVQRHDCTAFSVAADKDPDYAKAFGQAIQSGVTMLAYGCHVSPIGISLSQRLPIQDSF
jgi:sugar fermentation stimulation protein A